MEFKGESAKRITAIKKGLEDQLRIYREERKVLEDAMQGSTRSHSENGSVVTLIVSHDKISELFVCRTWGNRSGTRVKLQKKLHMLRNSNSLR